MIVEAQWGVSGWSQNSTIQQGEGMESGGWKSMGNVMDKRLENGIGHVHSWHILAGQIHEGQSWDRDRTLWSLDLLQPFVVARAQPFHLVPRQ